MDREAARLLRELESLKQVFDPTSARRKQALLQAIGGRRLATAGEVLRFHEILCFLRAYPDDRRLLVNVERLLAGFAARRGNVGYTKDAPVKLLRQRLPILSLAKRSGLPPLYAWPRRGGWRIHGLCPAAEGVWVVPDLGCHSQPGLHDGSHDGRC